MKRLVLLAIAFASCAPVTQSARLLSQCKVEERAALATVTDEQVSMLRGTFRLIQVDNADSILPPYAVASTLTLQVADSAERVRSLARRIPFQSGDRQLIGIRRWANGEADDSAEVSQTTLFLGCRECVDAGADGFRIHQIWPTGFSGTWYGSMGIGMRVTSDGRKLPDPSGYFCAQRPEDRSAR